MNSSTRPSSFLFFPSFRLSQLPKTFEILSVRGGKLRVPFETFGTYGPGNGPVNVVQEAPLGLHSGVVTVFTLSNKTLRTKGLTTVDHRPSLDMTHGCGHVLS